MKGIVRIRTDTSSFCFLHYFLIAIIVVSTDVISITGISAFEAVYWGWKTILIKICCCQNWNIRVSERIASVGILPVLPRAIEDWHELKIVEKIKCVCFCEALFFQTTTCMSDHKHWIWQGSDDFRNDAGDNMGFVWFESTLQKWTCSTCWHVKCYV